MPRLLAALVLLALPVAATAQMTEGEVEAMVVDEVLPLLRGEEVSPEAALDEIAGGFNLSTGDFDALQAFSLQAQGNLTLVRQDGLGNQLDANQTGDGNVAVVLQFGSQNLVSVEQEGTGNVVGIQVEGSGNELLGAAGAAGVRQLGAENVYLLELLSDGQLIPPTEQVGVGNQAVQTGEIGTPFGVQQVGDGMRMIIRHNGIE